VRSRGAVFAHLVRTNLVTRIREADLGYACHLSIHLHTSARTYAHSQTHKLAHSLAFSLSLSLSLFHCADTTLSLLGWMSSRRRDRLLLDSRRTCGACRVYKGVNNGNVHRFCTVSTLGELVVASDTRQPLVCAQERRRETRCALSSFYHVALSNSTHTTNRTVCYPGSI
jgi:hypothetical protein